MANTTIISFFLRKREQKKGRELERKKLGKDVTYKQLYSLLAFTEKLKLSPTIMRLMILQAKTFK